MSSPLATRVIEIIAKTQTLSIESVTLDKTFDELDIDSLDRLNILFVIEEELEISVPDDQLVAFKSVRDTVDGLERLLAAIDVAAGDRAAIKR
jgi:acyl carrier protein